MQAEAGWMELTGEIGPNPQRAGLSLVDYMTGMNNLFAVPFIDSEHPELVVVPYQLDTNDMKLWLNAGYTPDMLSLIHI